MWTTSGAPDAVVNDPGKSALQYRVGSYPTFRAAILRDIVEPLPEFTTRDSDDPTIAMIEAFSVGLDVLTFYQERLANESYLRTATERP